MTNARALSAFTANRFDEALAQAQAALAATPHDLQILNIAGISAARLGLAKEAERFWRKSLEINPKDAQSYSNLGVLYITNNRLVEAESFLRKSLELRPESGDTYAKLGHLLVELGREAEAESQYRAALKIDPRDAETHVRLGRLFYKQGKVAEAETCYRQATRLAPRYADAYFYLGNLQSDQERFVEAEGSFRAAVANDPNHGSAWSNLGVTLKTLRRYEEAEAAYKTALVIDPDDAQWIGNLGVLYISLQRFEDAERLYRKALALRPGYTDVIFNLSYVLLLRSRFREGFLCYEARYDPRMTKRACGTPDLSYPQWRGEDIAGKSISVWHEQGFGDVIQFARFARILKEKGAARVTLICMPLLRPFLQTLQGVDAFASPGPEVAALPPHDYWTLIASIPLHIGMKLETIPCYPSYLSPLPERIEAWKPRLQAPGIKIGIVWKACARHKSSAERSLPSLKTFRGLWDVPGLSFFSLQKEDGEEEGRNPPADQPLIHLGSDLADFADTAAIVSQLDLVISIDTAIVHVAGAVGKPVWVLLPDVADWRWLLGREDSPWYPNLRLFRQTKAYQWNDVVGKVFDALRAYLKSGA